MLWPWNFEVTLEDVEDKEAEAAAEMAWPSLSTAIPAAISKSPTGFMAAGFAVLGLSKLVVKKKIMEEKKP